MDKTMTDLEMTKLCAEAMFSPLEFEQRLFDYDPLHDDAQAMALVKRFKLNIGQMSGGAVQVFTRFDAGHIYQSDGTDLNRAIVGCVAEYQVDRTESVNRGTATLNKSLYG